MVPLLTLPACLILVASSVSAEPDWVAPFTDYPAPAYPGTLVLPDFDGEQAEYRNQRTRIRDGMLDPATTFAGSWSIIEIGCGTNCLFALVANRSDGSVIPFPLGPNSFLGFFYEPESRLMRATWVDSDPMDPKYCIISDFVLEDGMFRCLASDVRPISAECYD